MRIWPNSFCVSNNKYTIQQKLANAFAAQDFVILLAFILGMFVGIMASVVAAR